MIQSEDYTEIMMDVFCQEKNKLWMHGKKSRNFGRQEGWSTTTPASRNKIIVPRICVHDMWTIELAVISFLILTLLILTLNYSQYLLFIISKNLMTSSLQIRSLSNSMTSEPTTEFLSNQIVFFSLISRFFI
jgi:hypothetical protein